MIKTSSTTIKRLRSEKKIQVVEDPPRFYDPERDGVTFSLLKEFRNCREAARLSLNGWTSNQSSMALTFGSATHWVLQQVYDDVKAKRLKDVPSESYVNKKLDELEKVWKIENPVADGSTLEHFELTMLVLTSLIPLYFQHWKKDFTGSRWEKIESEFKIPYVVTGCTGREYKTFLRGKMDASFKEATATKPRLFETKTKSRIEESNLVDIMPFELQVNMYMNALWILDDKVPSGVLYNVIRRPGLRQKQTETLTQFATRLVDDIRMRPDWYFIRMEMTINKAELERFRLELADLVGDFLDWWAGVVGHYKNSDYCENKYGVCNKLAICSQRNYANFYKRKTVFRELVEEI